MIHSMQALRYTPLLRFPHGKFDRNIIADILAKVKYNLPHLELVIEILSPSTRRHDRLVKLDLYQRAGVREYWIVDPENKAVQVFLQDDGGSLILHEDYGRDDVAKVNVLAQRTGAAFLHMGIGTVHR